MTVAAATPDYGLWRSVLKLLRVSWFMSLTGFFRAGRRRKVSLVILGIIILAVIPVVFFASWGLISFLRSPAALAALDTGLLLSSVPAIILSMAFFVTLMFSFGVLLQGLYLAGDMEFLLSAPIPIRAVFLSKLLQAILPNFAITSLFALPVFWGLGAANGYNPLYFPLAVVILVAVAFAAAGLSSLLVMGVARVFPARTVAEVLSLIVGALALVLSQSGQFTRSFSLGGRQVQQGLQSLSFLDSPLSPFGWAGRSITDIGSGAWGGGLALAGLTLGVSAIIFVVALTTAERLYYSGWARVNAGGHRKRPLVHTAQRPRGVSAPGRLVPSDVRGLMWKDTLVLRRDLRSVSQFVGPLILTILYALLFLRGGGNPPAGRGEAPGWFMGSLRAIYSYGSVVLALFVGWTLLSRLALMSFSHESRYYWLIKTSPMSATRLLVSKFLIAFLPTLALAWFFHIVVSLLQHSDPITFLFGALVVLLCLAGGTGVFLAFGVTGANFAWSDPRHMVSGYASCLGSIVTGLYIVISLGFFLGPSLVVSLLRGPLVAGQLIGLGLGGILAVLCAVLPPYLIRGRAEHLGEV